MADTATDAGDATHDDASDDASEPEAPTAPPVADQRSRRQRISKWDRPPPPHDWRFFVGTLGKILLATGLLMFGFVAYQLWGTGLETARAQRGLESEFEELLASSTPTVAPTSTIPSDQPSATVPEATIPEASTPAPPTTVATTGPVDQGLPASAEGDPVARIEIPAIGVDDIVVQGVSVEALRKGPGHFPDTPMPGQLGNAAIAGHRTTYGQPFRDVDDLVPGDEIVVTTLAGRFVYAVTGTQIVSPSDYEVVLTTDPETAVLTLTSCHPVWSASQRIVISSELVEEASDPVGLPSFSEPSADDAVTTDTTLAPSATAPATAPAGTAPSTAPSASETTTAAGEAVPPATVPTAPPADESPAAQDAFAQGWFHDDGAYLQVALWGLALILISVGAWLISRRTRHDSIGLLVGVVPFAIALFFFFQNVNRLLPASL